MTGRRQPLISSFRAKREIFVVRGQMVNVWNSQTGNLLPADFRASPPSILRGAFRHPERSDMSDVRKCKGGTVKTESKDLAPYHHFSFLIHTRLSN